MSILLSRMVLFPEGVVCTLIDRGSGSVRCFVQELYFSNSFMLFSKNWLIWGQFFLTSQAYLIVEFNFYVWLIRSF